MCVPLSSALIIRTGLQPTPCASIEELGSCSSELFCSVSDYSLALLPGARLIMSRCPYKLPRDCAE